MKIPPNLTRFQFSYLTIGRDCLRLEPVAGRTAEERRLSTPSGHVASNRHDRFSARPF